MNASGRRSRRGKNLLIDSTKYLNGQFCKFKLKESWKIIWKTRFGGKIGNIFKLIGEHVCVCVCVMRKNVANWLALPHCPLYSNILHLHSECGHVLCGEPQMIVLTKWAILVTITIVSIAIPSNHLVSFGFGYRSAGSHRIIVAVIHQVYILIEFRSYNAQTKKIELISTDLNSF